MDIYFVPWDITQYYFIYFAAWIIPASFLSGSRLILQIPFPILESAIFPTSSPFIGEPLETRIWSQVCSLLLECHYILGLLS